MCELFGISASKKVGVNNLLREFYTHSERHPHGWGLAIFFGNYVSLEKEPVKASQSNYLKERLKHDLRVDGMIAHIRLATRGELKYDNCHPYIKRDSSGRCWTLAHNGTVFEPELLEPYVEIQEGSTDSERILYYFLEHINHTQAKLGRALDEKERFELLEKLIYDLTPENKLNLLFYDGEYLYAHTNYANSLYYKEVEEGVAIATCPLDDDKWERMPFAKLVVYKGAEIVYQGSHIGAEYFEKPGHNIAVDGIEYFG